METHKDIVCACLSCVLLFSSPLLSSPLLSSSAHAWNSYGALVKVQGAWRRHKTNKYLLVMSSTLRRKHKDAVMKRHDSAKFVQAAVRRLAARKEHKRRQRAAALITRVGRGFLARCAASVLRWKRSEERKERMRRGALLVQSLFRSSAVRRAIRRNRAAVLLQRQVRRCKFRAKQETSAIARCETHRDIAPELAHSRPHSLARPLSLSHAS